MADLLLIYDADDRLMRTTGPQRSGVDESVGVTGGIAGFRAALDKLVSERKTFERAVFHTHGNEGMIFFGGEAVDSGVLRKSFMGRGYETLFSYQARIYCNGCNVTEGNKGWEFLETAGSIFLGKMSGWIFGHTSSGYPLLPYPLMAFGGVVGLALGWSMRGHSPHVSGETRTVYVMMGGRMFGRSNGDEPRPAKIQYVRPPNRRI